METLKPSYCLSPWDLSGALCLSLWDLLGVPVVAGELLGLGLNSLPPSGRKVRYRELLETGYKVERWVQVKSDAVDRAMVGMCWRAPSTVTQLGCLIGRPQLVAALQPGSGICFSPSWTPPRARSAMLGAAIASPLLASPLLQPAKRGRGEIPPHHVLMPSFHSGGIFPSQESSPAPQGREDMLLRCSSAEVSVNKAPVWFHSTQ